MEYSEERQPPNVITSDTENATKVQPKEAPPHKQSKFERFRAYNTGTWNGPKRENKDVIYNQDNLHRFDSISSSLDLTNHQKNRGRKIVSNISFREMGVKVDGLIFGICILIVNDDVRNGSRYYPGSHRSQDGPFNKMADSLGFDVNEQLSFMEKIRSRVDEL